MSRRMMGLAILFVVSELLGVFIGGWFFRLFLKTVPPLALSSFNQAAARFVFIGYGLACGIAVFLLSALAAAAARFFTDPSDRTDSDVGAQ